MKTHIFPVPLFLTFVLSLFSTQIVYGKVYKLVDESGNPYFADQVAPEKAKYRRETLSNSGQVIDVVEQEKTKAQQEQDKILKQLRKKQDRIIQSQKAHDDALLRSYHSKEEMVEELKAKIQPLNAQKKLLEAELSQHTIRLDTTQKNAATFERNSQAVPASLITEIKTIQKEIGETKKVIDDNVNQQKMLSEEYEANIKRFLLLTQSDGTEQKNQIASIVEENALGLFRCENDFQCKKAWEVALVFVNTYSTTPPDINSNELVMHALPTKDDDFSLSIAKIASKNDGNQLFLDIHCRDSSMGKELCVSKKIQDLRESFRPYVNERLNSSVPTP